MRGGKNANRGTKKGLTLAAALMLMAFVAASCGGGGGSGTTSATTGTTGTVDGYVYVPIADAAARTAGRTALAQATYIPLAGASVTCGGKSATTEANGYYQLTNVPSGSQTLQITKSGYGTMTKTVSVSQGTTTTATSRNSSDSLLAPTTSGRISITSTPSGATVYLDGQDTTQTTPATLTNIPVGRHSLVAVLSGYTTAAPQTADVANGQTASVSFSLTARQDPSTIAVTAAASPAEGDTNTAYTVSCIVTDGTASSLEYRCHTSEPSYLTISSGSAAVCTYNIAGSFTPECRVNGTITDAVDTAITVSAGAVCGNGTLEGDEACDDGNTTSNDGCSSTCANEPATGVSASMSAGTGETLQALTLTCNVQGGPAQTIQARCSDAAGWTTIASGNTLSCTYRNAGTYTPSCYVDSAYSDNTDTDVTITLTTSASPNNTVVDTNQTNCYPDQGAGPMPSCPLLTSSSLYGQDAQYSGNQPSYTDNGDGTITDNNTGLLWEQGDNDSGRLGYYEAVEACNQMSLGGYTDWRIPTIKELFSITNFSATRDNDTKSYYFFGDYFELDVDWNMDLSTDPDHDDPSMMGQTWSSTIYVGDLWGRGAEAAQFMNLLDGHLKANETERATNLYRCVRGDLYGVPDLVNNGDGTVTDRASGLMWQQTDDGGTRDWPSALQYCEGATTGGYTDWRLPNIKELLSIMDYSTNSPAIDTSIFTQTNSAGWFWSSTSYEDGSNFGIYACFGICTSTDGTDTHGNGVRGEYKVGNPSDYANLGNQADEVRINNYARCVRDES